MVAGPTLRDDAARVPRAFALRGTADHFVLVALAGREPVDAPLGEIGGAHDRRRRLAPALRIVRAQPEAERRGAARRENHAEPESARGRSEHQRRTDEQVGGAVERRASGGERVAVSGGRGRAASVRSGGAARTCERFLRCRPSARAARAAASVRSRDAATYPGTDRPRVAPSWSLSHGPPCESSG